MWTNSDELLAGLLELTDRWGRQAALDRGHKSFTLGPPLRVTRPGQEPEPSSNVVSIGDFVKSNTDKRKAG